MQKKLAQLERKVDLLSDVVNQLLDLFGKEPLDSPAEEAVAPQRDENHG